MSKQLTKEEGPEILTYLKMDYSLREVANKMGVDHTKMLGTKARYEKFGVLDYLGGNDRRKVLSKNTLAAILSLNEKELKNSLRKMAAGIKKNMYVQINYETIKRELHRLGLKAFSPCKKPLLMKQHIKLGKLSALTGIYFNKEQNNTIIWSDEIKINLFSSDAKIKVWGKKESRLNKKHIHSTVKYEEAV